MKDTTERDVERLLRGGRFSNPAHKAALREQLFERGRPLSLEELDKVVGGVTPAAQELWKPWPETKNEQN